MREKKKTVRCAFIIYFCICIFYLAWRWIFTIPLEKDLISLILGIMLLFAETCYIWHMFIRMRHALKVDKQDENHTFIYEDKNIFYPDIDIVINASGKKAQEVLRTVNGCLLLDYPSNAKVCLFVVDSKERKEIKQLIEKKSVQYTWYSGTDIDRLNYAYKRTKNEYMAVFEAGIIPQHDFLMITIARLLETERAGFVQTAVGSFNPDSYQFRLFSEDKIPEENRYFQAVHQPAATLDNATVLCGTNVVFSRKALDEIDGFVKGNLLTGIRIQEANYKCIYIKEMLASGIYQSDLNSFFSRKWKQIKEITDVFGCKLKLNQKQKTSYYSYVSDQLGQVRTLMLLGIPIIAAFFGVTLWECNIFALLCIWFCIYIAEEVCLQVISDRTTNVKWRKIYEVSTFPFLLFSLINAKCGKSEKKQSNNKIGSLLSYIMPHSTLILLSILGCVNGIRLLCIDGYSQTIMLLIICLLNNSYYLLMSLFWVTGRPYVRQEERIVAEITCEIRGSGHVVTGKTRDLAQRSVSVWCDMPYDLDDEDEYEIALTTERYHAEVKGNIVGVQYEEGKWRYVFSLTEESESLEQYCGILYDRKPFTVERMEEHSLWIKDVYRNIGRRFKHKTLQYRKMPRILVNDEIKLSDMDGLIYVKNFNYKFLITYVKESPLDYMKLQPIEGVIYECEKFHKFGEHTYLYKIINYDKLHNDEEIRKIQYSWILKCLNRNREQLESDNLIKDNKITYI